MLLLVPYLLLAWAAGLGLTFVSRLPWDFEGRLAMGLPLGFSAAALCTWLIAIPFGMSDAAVAVGALALLLVLAACLRWTDWRGPLQTEAVLAVSRWRRLESLPLMILLSLAILFFVPFYSHALKRLPDGLYGGYFTMFGDWAAHLSLAGYLSTATHVLPPENPWFAGTHLNYPFLPDFFSGMLLHLGVGFETALSLISAILSLALVVIFYSTTVRLTRSHWAGLFAALVLFVGGGLGFTHVLTDIVPTGSGPMGWLTGLINLITSPPHEYTMDPANSTYWLTPILAYLIPQRTTLFGWSLGLLVLSLLWHAWTTRTTRDLLLAGLVLGLMPLFHANTYVDLLVIGGGLALLSLSWWRSWFHYFVPALALGIPQLLMILPPAAYRHSFGWIQLGWMASTAGHHDNIIWFWLINTGLLIPLALLTVFAGRWSSPELRRFLLPAWLLFLIPNIVVLQPWDFDNTKWLVWWAIPASMLVGLVIARLALRGLPLATLAGLVLFVQIASGSLDLDRAWQEKLNLPNLRLLNNDDLALAAWVRQETPVDSIFLTSWNFNHPVRVLGARVQVMAGLVSLWGTGIDYRERLQDETAMFRGDFGTPTLLTQYRVSYVVIGPSELQDAGANLAYYRGRYPIVYQSPSGGYQIFRVR